MGEPIILETKRLLLRRFRLDDLESLAAILGDPETVRFYPEPFTRERTLKWIEDNLRRYEADGFGLWAVQLKSTGEFIGDCGPAVQDVEDAREIELGWHVRRQLWGKGLATEAATVSRDWVFENLAAERLISLIRPENQASRRVAEKIGMQVSREVAFGSKGWPHLLYEVTPARAARFDSASCPGPG